MAIDAKELGRRLRQAREACGMTQQEVARHLGVSRPTVVQMEQGNRMVTGIEVSRLAYLYGRDVRDLLADDPPGPEGGLGVLFRLQPELAHQEPVREALRRCMALGREWRHLERMLGIGRDVPVVKAAYWLPKPRNVWEAIRQGEVLADQERRRLGLSTAERPEIGELLEDQGVLVAMVQLPEAVSGLTLLDGESGPLVAVNGRHPLVRMRFSLAHEYCHLLADSERKGIVSVDDRRDELSEVRANAFAAAFLMPAEAVQDFVRSLGKGRSGRMAQEVFDEVLSVRGGSRSTPGRQDIGIHDLVLLAHRFGVSRASAAYRLKNLGLVSDQERDRLEEMDRSGRGRAIEQALAIQEAGTKVSREIVPHRFLALGMEACRRGLISPSKLGELACLAGLEDEAARHLVEDCGADCDEGVDVRIPGE